MHDQIADNVQPDPLLSIPISDDERERIAELNALKAGILQNEKFMDISAPAKAFLTRISGFANSDLDALKLVEMPADHINEQYLQEPRSRGWLQYIRLVNIRRLPPAPSEPEDGDISPVFTIHEEGFEEAYVFFYYEGGWRFLTSDPRDGLWRTWADEAVKSKLKEIYGVIEMIPGQN
jgi:hypothetical protein